MPLALSSVGCTVPLVFQRRIHTSAPSQLVVGREAFNQVGFDIAMAVLTIVDVTARAAYGAI
jgi:hypothetical protein